MIKIICDICGKEPQGHDFSFEATKQEIVTTLQGELLNPQERIQKAMYQICKDCFYKHIDKLLKHD
jgi:hypothetical protein